MAGDFVGGFWWWCSKWGELGVENICVFLGSVEMVQSSILGEQYLKMRKKEKVVRNGDDGREVYWAEIV